jgi:hypothetical protein
MVLLSERRRSVAFLEHEGETWACFLVARVARNGRWTGFFSFRPGDGELDEDEIRTADIFIENSEAEIHEKARGLGRPLLGGLLASALHKSLKAEGRVPRLRRQFRELLVGNALELAGEWNECDVDSTDRVDPQSLRSLYASYRLDQVVHFILLVESTDFVEAVDQILEGERIDFRASDRIQFAMMVVEYIERRLALPPYEVWVRDFLDHPESYRLYAHTLHREGRLP